MAANHADLRETFQQPPDLELSYRTLVEQIPAVVFMARLDEGLSRAYVSPHIEKILGFSQEEWLGDPMRWHQRVHPDDRGRWNKEAAAFVLSGQPLRSALVYPWRRNRHHGSQDRGARAETLSR